MRQKWIAVVLAAVSLVPLSGCGEEQAKSESRKQTETTTKIEETVKGIEDATQKTEETTLKTESTITVETTTTQAPEPELADIMLNEEVELYLDKCVF